MKLEKSEALYVNSGLSSYICENCAFFLPTEKKCFIHNINESVQPYDSCNHFIKGDYIYGSPLGITNKHKSGFIQNSSQLNISCFTCANHLPDQEDCNLVERNSIGDDLGKIKLNGCCNLWDDKKRQLINISSKKQKDANINSDETQNKTLSIREKMLDIKNRIPKLLNSDRSPKKNG